MCPFWIIVVANIFICLSFSILAAFQFHHLMSAVDITASCLSIYQFFFCLATSDTPYACNDPTGKNHVLRISQPLSSEV